MAKRMRTITAGNLVKIAIYTAPEPNDNERVRAEKSRATTAAQKAMNDKTARSKLEMSLAANFGSGDLLVTLTYTDADLPEKRTGAVQSVRRFLRQLREQRRRQGHELRYVYTTENKHGEGRFHHHMIINAAGRDVELLRSLWLWGAVHIKPFDGRSFEATARYMTKEGAEKRPVGAQMWTGSRNLRKPKVETCYIPNGAVIETPIGVHIIEREERQTEYGYYGYVKYYKPPQHEREKLLWGIEGEPL